MDDISQLYRASEYYLAATQLVLAMLGMGTTLKLRDFRDILMRPTGVAYVLAAQYVALPLAAWGIANVWELPPGVFIGIMLVISLPSGALSNIFALLGKGNVALSITATTASTIASLVLTPAVLGLLVGGRLPSEFEMPVRSIAAGLVMYLLIPLAAGMLLRAWCEPWYQAVGRWTIRGSLAVLVMIVAGSLKSGRIEVAAYGWGVPLLLIAMGLLMYAIPILVGVALRFSLDDAFTMAVEAAFRNGNVGILLASSLFPATSLQFGPLGQGVMFAVLFYSGAQIFIIGAMVIARRLILRMRAARQGVAGADTGA